MKLRYTILLMLILLCLTCPAFAETQTEFEQLCTRKTGRDATVYHTSVITETATSTDLMYGPFEAVGTLSAGTYLSVISTEMRGKYEVFYYSGSGKKTGWIDSDAIASAVVTFPLPDGRKYAVPERAYGNDAAVRKYMSEWYSEADISVALNAMHDHMDGKSSASQSSGSGKKKVSTSKAEQASLTATRVLGDGETETVEVAVIGSVYCLLADEANTSVPTSELIFADDVDAEHQLATIHAPRTGRATLYAEASNRSKALQTCKAGRIAVVLEVGEAYTRVFIDGKQGYVRSDALTFRAAADAETVIPAKLSYKGKTNGSTTINVRLEAGGRKIDAFRTGTEAYVLQSGEDWSLIELEGFIGYIQSQFLTQDD